MANEARILEAYGSNSDGRAMRYGCATGNSIPYGTLMQAGDPHLASFAQAWTLGSSYTSGAFVGICGFEKDATDSIAEVILLTDVMADLKASGAITAFATVICAGNNEIKEFKPSAFQGTTASEALFLVNSMNVGISQETASDGELVRVRINK